MAWYRTGGGGAGVEEISTDAGMTEVLTSANVGKYYKFTGTTGTYTNGDLYEVEETPSVIGGRIFYVGADNGATYTFYDSSYNELTTQTVAGLENAVYYRVSGTPTTDKFYVYDNTTHTTSDGTTTYTANNGLVSSIVWGYHQISTNIRSSSIGSGKPNTNTILAITDTSSYNTNTIWKYIKACRDNNLNECNDWYIGTSNEQNQLRLSGLVDWYSNTAISIWCSEEYEYNNKALYWDGLYSSWEYEGKYQTFRVVAMRSF